MTLNVRVKPPLEGEQLPEDGSLSDHHGDFGDAE